jgi:TRAP-type C4-dicarboxylate transport system permease small subunit
MSFTHTFRKVVSIVLILLVLLMAIPTLNRVYEFWLFRDSWALSQLLTYTFVVLILSGIAAAVHPSDTDAESG